MWLKNPEGFLNITLFKYLSKNKINMEDKRSKFLNIFANIPENLRKDIIVSINKKPYTWNTAFIEIRDDTSLGKKILKTLEEIGII